MEFKTSYDKDKDKIKRVVDATKAQTVKERLNPDEMISVAMTMIGIGITMHQFFLKRPMTKQELEFMKNKIIEQIDGVFEFSKSISLAGIMFPDNKEELK